MKLSVCCFAIFCCTAFCTTQISLADTRDTLSLFDPLTASTFYRDPGIRAQAARFDLPAPACLRSITLWLGGRGTGTATVTVYGNEGAFPAPLLEQALCRLMTFRKTEPGVQRVQVLLPEEVCLNGTQFFVQVSDLDEGIVWLSDRKEKQPRCAASGEQWLYQGIKGSDGTWRLGRYGYAVEVVLDYPEEHPANYLQDVTSELIPSSGGVAPSEARRSARGGQGSGGLRTSGEGSGTSLSNATEEVNSSRGVSAEGGQGSGGLRTSGEGSGASLPYSPENPSIAWSDFNNDGYIDLLFNGHLWMNSEGDRFEESGDRTGGPLGSNLHHVLDLENDGDQDILVFERVDGSTKLLENDGNGYFRWHVLDLPPIHNLISISFADGDSDGYLDMFIVQGHDTVGQQLPDYYLKNDGGEGFNVEEQSELISASGTVSDLKSNVEAETLEGARSVQWIDWNNDGHPDLSVTAGEEGQSRVYRNDGEGGHPYSWTQMSYGTSVGISQGTDWGDVDSDGDLDLLAPVNLGPEELAESALGARTIHESVNETENEQSGFWAVSLPWEGFNGSGLWADVDNNGRLDALILTGCDCLPARLYTQERNGEFAKESFAWGLHGLPAGSDGVWVDWNNDGKLDLSTFVGGALRLLENTYDGEGDWISVDLSGAPSGLTTGRVILYTATGEQIRPIVSGRGALMQGPHASTFRR